MGAPKLATRPLRVKLPRPGDSGHLIRGVGYVAECSCGWHSTRQPSTRAAMQAGRDHAAEHREPEA